MAGPSFDEQRLNVVQLSRDRKNGIGGYHQSLKDFAEMGPPSSGHWPLSAEQIRRAFGVPKDQQDPDTVYFLTLRAESHSLLEQTAQQLRAHAPRHYSAWNTVFDPDAAGDRDYETVNQALERGDAQARGKLAYAKTLKEGVGHEKEIARLERDVADWRFRSADTRDLLVRCDMFIVLLTNELKNEDLFVEFARRMTRMQEQAGDRANAQIWDEYQDLLSKKPKSEAKSMIRKKWGISERTLARIEEGRRAEQGLPPRGRGRPRKDAS